jgi:hypothetical protein
MTDPPKTTQGRHRSYLSTLEFQRLEHACSEVARCLDSPPYLVGSATERPDFRDVDVRSIMADEEFDRRFGDDVEFWSLFCLGVSAYLSQVSGLRIDYQVQRRTEANEKHGSKPRNPMGHGYRNFAGGGDFR